MKKLITILLLLAGYFAEGQPLDRDRYTKMNAHGYIYKRTIQDSVIDIPHDTMYSKTGLARINNKLFVGNDAYWTPVSVPLTPDDDSVTIHWPFICVWDEGTAYACANLALKDTVVAKHPLNVILKETSGALFDTLRIKGSNTPGQVLTTGIDSNHVSWEDPTGGGGGVSDSTLQQIFDNAPTANPQINAAGNEVVLNNAADFDFITGTDPSVSGSYGEWSLYPDFGGMALYSDTTTTAFNMFTNGADLTNTYIVSQTTENSITYNQRLSIYPKVVRVEGQVGSGNNHAKFVLEKADTLLTTPSYIWAADGDTLKKYPYSAGGGGSVQSVTGTLVDNTDPTNPVINAPPVVADPSFTWAVLDSLSTPAVGPATGDIYEVSTVPTGAWVGHAKEIATWDGAAWTFEVPATGDIVFRVSNDLKSKYNGTFWVRVGKTPIVQGRQIVGASMSIGTLDNTSLLFGTNNATRLQIGNTGLVLINGLTGSGNAITGLTSAGVLTRVATVPISNIDTTVATGLSQKYIRITDGVAYNFTSLANGDLLKYNSGTTQWNNFAPSYLIPSDTINKYPRLIAGSNITITGTYPNQTIAASGGGGGDSANLNIATTTGLYVGTIRQNGARFIHTYGVSNTFVGDSSGNFTMTGTAGEGANTGIGNQALPKLTTGFRNTAVGYKALFQDTSGHTNTAIGAFALTNNRSGTGNIAIGYNVMPSNLTGITNIAIGQTALNANTSGTDNVAIGAGALAANTTGTVSVAVGGSALALNTASGNVAVGDHAMAATTSGANNVAMGPSALASNQTGTGNVAMGYYSAYSVTSTNNVGIGQQALYVTTSGGDNTAVGMQTMLRNTTGANNTAIGSMALLGVNGNATYSNNIGLGNKAGYYTINSNQLYINSIDRSNYTGDTTNSIIYGLQSATAANQRLKLGGGGNVGIDVYPLEKLSVNGNLSLATAGNKIKIATGSNASVGVSGAMTAGTITISTTAVTASSLIFLVHATTGGTQGILSVGTITAGTSFVINSSNAADTGTVNWWIVN